MMKRPRDDLCKAKLVKISERLYPAEEEQARRAAFVASATCIYADPSSRCAGGYNFSWNGYYLLGRPSLAQAVSWFR